MTDQSPPSAADEGTPRRPPDETEAYGDGPDTGSGRLAVRCPRCQAATNVSVDTSLSDLTCGTCGSQISLIDSETTTRGATPLSRLGRFDLVERLGVGGFGAVWKAHDKELDRTVALKIPRQGMMSPAETEKFLREARAAAQLRHPGIVSVHEVGRDGDTVFIVSDFVRGVTLSDWLTGQELTNRDAAELVAKVAGALEHAHEHGVIHRDLKPGNIMMDGGGEPHLMDFGLARREAGEATLTQHGQVLGTPAYMSPEQARGDAHEADRRSDVYSLGVILFELLTGELPFRGNARMLTLQVINEPAPSPRKFNAAISKDFETITLKCLEKEPGRRFATARELGEELRRTLAGEPIHARPVGPLERAWRMCRRHPQVSILSALLVAALIAGVAVSMLQAIRATASATQYRQERDRAEESLALAEKVVEGYLTSVAEDERLSQAGFHELRTKLLETAAPFYEQLAQLKPGNDQGDADRAGAYGRLATIHSETGEGRKSVGEYEQAIAIQSSLTRRFPENPNYRQDLARHHQGAGWNLLLVGDLEAGQQHYQQSLAILDKLVEEFPDEPAYRQSLAATHEGFGLVLRYRDWKAGRLQFELAIAAEEKLVHDHPGVPEYERLLASSSFYLANLMRSRDVDLATKYLTTAEALQSDLMKRFPDEPEYRAALAETFATQAYVLSKKRNMGAADKRYLEAIDTQTKVMRTHPNVVKYRVILAGLHIERAQYCALVGAYQAAAQEGVKFADIYDQLAQDFPDVRKYHRNAADGHADCARYYLLARELAKSLEHREHALRIRRQYPQYFSTSELAQDASLWDRATSLVWELKAAAELARGMSLNSADDEAKDVSEAP